jgi:hypothetical protein
MLRTASHIYQLAVRINWQAVVNWKALRSPFLLAHCLAGPLRRALWPLGWTGKSKTRGYLVVTSADKT